MPRRVTQFVLNHYYHIYNRGSGRNLIFHESENYLYLLRLLKHYMAETQVAVIAYCLLPNHYHILLRQDSDTPAGLFIQRTFNAYTKAFNKRYQRTGTLFEGRFHSVWVDNDAYLLQLCRYIHANPVKACLAIRLEEWPYSNYMEWIGLRKGSLVDLAFVEDNFYNRDSYASFVSEYLTGQAGMPPDVEAYLLDR